MQTERIELKSPACKADALPIELSLHAVHGGLEPHILALKGLYPYHLDEWTIQGVGRDLNSHLPDPQSDALPIMLLTPQWAGWVSSPLPPKGTDLQSAAFADSLPTQNGNEELRYPDILLNRPALCL